MTRLAEWKVIRTWLRAFTIWGGAESHPDCAACLSMMTALGELRDPAGSIALILRAHEPHVAEERVN